MNRAEYDRRISAEMERHKNEMNIICITYLESNKKYNKGDILKQDDSGFLIRVENLTYSQGKDGPVMLYKGPELTKKMQPRKNGSWRGFYENDCSLVLGAQRDE
jgi:hypothetical protein